MHTIYCLKRYPVLNSNDEILLLLQSASRIINMLNNRCKYIYHSHLPTKKVCVALFIVDRLKQKTEFLILSYLAQQQTLINYSNISALTARRHAKTHLKH